MLKALWRRGPVVVGTVVLVVVTYVVAAAASGGYFWHHHPSSGGDTNELNRTIAISASGGTGNSSADLSFDGLLPGVTQTRTVSFRNTGNTTEDVYLKFPNATALSALNSNGREGSFDVSSSGAGAVGAVFASSDLSDSHASCGTFSPSGCWPLLSSYVIAHNLAPNASGSLSFSFTFASIVTKQAPVGSTFFWNPFPVSGQTYVGASDGSGAGLPYEIEVTSPNTAPGAKQQLRQASPTGESVTVANSGGSFSAQLEVQHATGAVTYVVTSPNAHLKVSANGVVTTIGGPLSVGTYVVSGTDSDGQGDGGTWSFTLTVTKGTILCTGSPGRHVSRNDSGRSFSDQVDVSGAYGPVNYVVSPKSFNPHLSVSNRGVVTTVGGPLANGVYTVSGTDSDSHGDNGTWNYSLTVSS